MINMEPNPLPTTSLEVKDLPLNRLKVAQLGPLPTGHVCTYLPSPWLEFPLVSMQNTLRSATLCRKRQAKRVGEILSVTTSQVKDKAEHL